MSEIQWDLERLDPGELSALRRSAGAGVNRASMAALRAFYKACGYCEPWQEQYWFPAVCMDALWRNTDGITVLPMQECMRRLLSMDAGTTESMQHRMDMLLDTTWSDDEYLIGKMLNLVKIVKSKTQLKPDFQMLARDFQNWNRPSRSVQREWLRTLYNVKTTKSDEEEAENAH